MVERKIIEGISYGSALKSTDRLCHLLRQRNIGIVEAPISSVDEYRAIYDICSKKDVKVSLHIPSPELVDKYPFLLRISSFEEIDRYIGCIVNFIKLIPLPEYVLVHFPMFTETSDIFADKRLDLYFAKKIYEWTRDKKIKLYYENIAIKNDLCLAKDYLPYMKYADGMVFDCGHAHSLACFLERQGEARYVQDFFYEMSSFIKGIHLYNTVDKAIVKNNGEEYIAGAHYPFVNKYDGIEGFMNRKKIIKSITKLPNLDWIIYEPELAFMTDEADYGDINI